ncbi:uncharacterized, partial [Tachysurus ichikawai]
GPEPVKTDTRTDELMEGGGSGGMERGMIMMMMEGGREQGDMSMEAVQDGVIETELKAVEAILPPHFSPESSFL